MASNHHNNRLIVRLTYLAGLVSAPILLKEIL